MYARTETYSDGVSVPASFLGMVERMMKKRSSTERPGAVHVSRKPGPTSGGAALAIGADYRLVVFSGQRAVLSDDRFGDSRAGGDCPDIKGKPLTDCRLTRAGPRLCLLMASG